MTLDNYTATYDAGETSEVIIDILIAVLVAIFGFATLIGLLLLFGWMKKSGIGRGI